MKNVSLVLVVFSLVLVLSGLIAAPGIADAIVGVQQPALIDQQHYHVQLYSGGVLIGQWRALERPRERRGVLVFTDLATLEKIRVDGDVIIRKGNYTPPSDG